jgi:hypothetical protein
LLIIIDQEVSFNQNRIVFGINEKIFITIKKLKNDNVIPFKKLFLIKCDSESDNKKKNTKYPNNSIL